MTALTNGYCLGTTSASPPTGSCVLQHSGAQPCYCLGTASQRTRHIAAFCGPASVPSQHQLEQDLALCNLIWSRCDSAWVSLPKRIQSFATFFAPASVQPRHRVPQHLTFCSLLWSCLGMPSVPPQRHLVSAPPPTGSHALGHHWSRFCTASAPPATESNILEQFVVQP